MASLASPPRRLTRGATIRASGEPIKTLDLLVEGWAASAVTFSNGTRQLVSINLPGDLLGLPALSVEEPIDDVVALGEVSVRSVPLSALTILFEKHPRLAAVLFLIAQEERVLAMERIALMGQTVAKARLAALFVRLNEKLGKSDENWPDRFHLPLTQQDLADLIGISTVHVNGILQELRSEGIIRLANREFQILDRTALITLAGVRKWRQSHPTWLPT